ncbi:MAG: aspartate carbamoyltransferase catalytic subunit [Chloroflexi bacterium]|nr:aspartate carbamoyltransferase catalytic subunit [Chloroflexota bacterium]
MTASRGLQQRGAAGTSASVAEAKRPPETPGVTWRRKHILDLDDFTAEEVELVLQTAAAMAQVLRRGIPRVPTLRGRTIVTLFYEASTRTRVAFELAAKALSADVVSVAAQTSSASKGESLVDTARTLRAMGADVIVMRHPSAGAPYLLAEQQEASVINAGDGWHAHPSQALLDLYTLRQHLADLQGRKVVIVGDILHSRVARSNVWGLTHAGAHVVLCGPPTLVPSDLGPGAGDPLGLPPVEVEPVLDRALEAADVVMALRLQRERQQAGLLTGIADYIKHYQVTASRLARAKPGVLFMHPGPMNEGIEVAPEVARGPHSMVEEQVSNGVAVRMALLYLIAGTQPRAPS